MNTKSIFLFSLIASFCLFQKTSKAGHLIGAEIEYRCQGNGVYQVNVRAYAECTGFALSQSDLMVTAGTTTLVISNQTKTSVRDLTFLGENCGVQSKCAGSSFPYGFEEHSWTMTLDLSGYSDCEWILTWEQCCRNGNITTGQANHNYYTMAMINKCVVPCNSSPTFSIAPNPLSLLCYNQDVIINNGAIDTIDSGDSLSYELVSALSDSGQNTPYGGNFSPARPLSFFGFPNQNSAFPAGFHLDAITGDLSFRPVQANQMAVIVVEVKEWRKINGTMQVIGKTRRDIQAVVMNCPSNKAPTISGPYHYDICAGNQVCIPIEVNDENPNDTVRISWNKGIPSATFTHTNGVALIPQGEVCWTPGQADVSSTPYSFTIIARDNACPIPRNTIKNFTITVNPPNSETQAALSVKVFDCRWVAIDHTPLAGYSGYSFKYTVRDSADSTVWTSMIKQDTTLLKPGKYYIDLWVDADHACPNTIRDSFIVTGQGNLGFTGQASVCDGELVFITPIYNIGVSPIIFDWYEVHSSGQSGKLASFSQFSVRPTRVTSYIGIANITNCIIVDTTLVYWSPNPVTRFKPSQDTACLKNAYFLFTDSSTISSGVIVERFWDFDDGRTSYVQNPTHQFLADLNFDIKLKTTSDSGCTDSITHSIVVLPTPVLAPVQHQLNKLRGSSASFSVGNVHPHAQYQWQVDSGQGFVNLSNSGQYSGVNSFQLIVSNVQLANNNTIYQCIVTLGNCAETSNTGVLSVVIGTGVDVVVEAKFRIYPNPTSHDLNIELIDIKGAVEISIINSAGSKVYSETLHQNSTTLDVSFLPKGIYFIMMNEERNNGVMFIKE